MNGRLPRPEKRREDLHGCRREWVPPDSDKPCIRTLTERHYDQIP